jgi:hypothetical protein
MLGYTLEFFLFVILVSFLMGSRNISASFVLFCHLSLFQVF